MPPCSATTGSACSGPTISAYMAANRNDVNVPVWDDRPWHPLPPLKGRVDTEVCVVGLGGSGLNVIGELLDLGVDVVGLERGRVGGSATGRNGGFFLAGTADFHHRAAML